MAETCHLLALATPPKPFSVDFVPILSGADDLFAYNYSTAAQSTWWRLFAIELREPSHIVGSVMAILAFLHAGKK